MKTHNRLRKLRETYRFSAENCLICLEKLTESSDIGYLPCAHLSWCFDCIVSWSNSTNTCPLCKSKFNAISRAKKDLSGISFTGEITQVENRTLRPNDAMDLLLEIRCEFCGSGSDPEIMLLCDGCDRGFHTSCIGIQGIPHVDDWYCHDCVVEQERDVCRNVWTAMREVGLPYTPHRVSEGNYIGPDREFEDIARSIDLKRVCN